MMTTTGVAVGTQQSGSEDRHTVRFLPTRLAAGFLKEESFIFDVSLMLPEVAMQKLDVGVKGVRYKDGVLKRLASLSTGGKSGPVVEEASDALDDDRDLSVTTVF